MCNILEIGVISTEDDYSSNYEWDIQSAVFESLSYQQFFENNMMKNIPCIVKNVSSAWECAVNWVENNTIHYDNLKLLYGELIAPVADCNKVIYNSHCKHDMNILDFMNYLESNVRHDLLYLKDWHLRRARPDDRFYDIPQIFGSDWLNEYSQDKNEDDFMFVYIGPKASWTPLHADVYSSYSWSVNVVGRKKWILFPPGEEEKLKDSLGNLPSMLKPEMYNGIKYFAITQEKGDAIFVPSGWYHQVINEVDTISVNHNWINGCNIEKVWEALTKTLISVECEIEEFRDTNEFPLQCQLILKSIFGMDLASFINFLCHIGQKRLNQLQGGNSLGLDNFCLGPNQIKFDLKQVLKVLNLITEHPVFFNNKNTLTSIEFDFLDLRCSITRLLK